jgi:pimeloyl-ACP methyl ester carboxylesterase
MTRFFALAISLALSAPLFADDKPAAKKGAEGFWVGTLSIGAVEVRLGLKIESKGGKLVGSIDAIDQDVKGIPVEKVEFADGKLTLKMPAMKSEYVGKMQPDGDTIKGDLEQGAKYPLDFKRMDKPVELVRPQHPKKPYPYIEEDVTFDSKAKDVKLAATFTKPKGDGPFSAVALITGSGPQDRDESLTGHKPFLVIADYLTRRGIAVLRYDDRGIGKSTGKFSTSTSKDFADDAAGAVTYLRSRKDVGKIGLMGHSEGGMIAPMVAAENPDVGFIILLAGPGTPCDELMIAQGQLIVKAMGGGEKALARQKEVQTKLFELVKKGADAEQLKNAIAEMEKNLSEEEKKEAAKTRATFDAQVGQLTGPWFRFFLNYDPRPKLEKVKCPVLAINGENDLQVPPKENLKAIEKAVKAGGNKDVTIKEFPGLNHLFQPCKTGLPTEYGRIETTFAPEALELIAEWIAKRK